MHNILFLEKINTFMTKINSIIHLWKNLVVYDFAYNEIIWYSWFFNILLTKKGCVDPL